MPRSQSGVLEERGSCRLDRGAHGTPVGPLSLRTNFSWTLIGNVVLAACQWGMLIFLARRGTQRMVGHFALGLAITAPIALFSSLQLRTLQATDVGDDHSFGQYLGLRFVTNGLAILAMSVVVLVAGYQNATALTILAIGLSKLIDQVADIFHSLLQKHERMDKIGVSMILRGVATLGALAGGVFLGGGLVWGTLGMVGSSLGVLLLYDVPTVRRWSGGRSLVPRFDGKELVRLARLAFPLGVVTLLTSLIPNLPRYFVEHHQGAAALGVFAALGYLMLAGVQVMAALSQSASPQLARHHFEGRAVEFRRLLGKLVGIGLAVGAAGILVALVLGRPLLMVLYGPDYSMHYKAFRWVMAAAAASYLSSVLNQSMVAARQLRIQVIIYASTVLATALASAWLVPRGGLTGACQALAVSALVQVCGCVLVNVRISRELSRRSETPALP